MGGEQPLAGQPLGRILLSSVNWHGTAPMWHHVVTELEWLLSSPGLRGYEKLGLLFFLKSQCQILPFYHHILVLFSPCAVAEFWFQMLSFGGPGGMRGCVG